MAKRQKRTEMMEEGSIHVDETYDKLEAWLEDNKQAVFGVVTVIAVVILGFFGYKSLIVAPKEKEAASQIFKAQQYFESDSFRLALEGDENYPGFEELASNFKVTRAGKLARYYAGISHLNLGNYEDAIDYLSKFKTDDPFVGSVALGGLGDAHAELGELDKSVSFYVKAAEKGDNEITSPLYLIRAGKAYEELGQYEKALSQYQKAEEDYPGSELRLEAQKNKQRIQTLLKQ